MQEDTNNQQNGPTCLECENQVQMTTEEGQEINPDKGDVVICDKCGAELEVVDKDPLKFELLEEAK